MSTQQCMGGWCAQREKCAHYWAPEVLDTPPAERLCFPGEHGQLLATPPTTPIKPTV